MVKRFWQRYAKNERGLTLIELLAVIVILGIVTAIAVPSVGTIIDNSRKDAHVANAKLMANAARQWLTANPNQTWTNNQIEKSLEDLNEAGLINVPQFPGGGENYDDDNTLVQISRALISGSSNTYTYTYKVTLDGTQSNAVVTLANADTLTRDNITLP